MTAEQQNSVEPNLKSEDPLSGAKGVINGLLISACIWLVIFLIYWVFA